MRRVLISTKPFIFVLFPVGVTVRSAESLSSAIPLGTSTKRANHGRSRLFQDAVSSVSFWLRSFSVRAKPLLPFAAPPQVRRLCRWSRLHSVWRRGSRCPACLAGSRAQFDSATRFSSPGDLPSSAAFSRRRWQSGTPLSCARRLLSSWQRMQSSRSLQPR